jgi:hypothetical protein
VEYGTPLMNYEICLASDEDREFLAELRISAMKESLENVGRFDPVKARNRFLANGGEFIDGIEFVRSVA